MDWDRKNEDKLLMIEQLQREMESTVDAYHSVQSAPHRQYLESQEVRPPVAPSLVHRNKFGHKDSAGSMLEFVRNAEGVSARLQVEQRQILAECKRLENENIMLKDQNKRLLEDKEHITIARRDAEGKLSFRMQQVLELEANAQKFARQEEESSERIKTLEYELRKAKLLLEKSETDVRVEHVRNAFLERKVSENQTQATGVPIELYNALKGESALVIEGLQRDISDIKLRYGVPEHHEPSHTHRRRATAQPQMSGVKRPPTGAAADAPVRDGVETHAQASSVPVATVEAGEGVKSTAQPAVAAAPPPDRGEGEGPFGFTVNLKKAKHTASGKLSETSSEKKEKEKMKEHLSAAAASSSTPPENVSLRTQQQEPSAYRPETIRAGSAAAKATPALDSAASETSKKLARPADNAGRASAVGIAGKAKALPSSSGKRGAKVATSESMRGVTAARTTSRAADKPLPTTRSTRLSKTTAKTSDAGKPRSSIHKETLSEPIDENQVSIDDSTLSDDTILDSKFKASNARIPPAPATTAKPRGSAPKKPVVKKLVKRSSAK